MVQAQQTYAASVATYLTALGSLWTSVTAVADLIRTDDLFQFARPEAVPPLPGVDQLPPLPCCHPSAPPPASMSAVAAPDGSTIPVPAYVPKEKP